MRKTADLRTGAFLRKLAATRSSRILVSTRLYPADLQMDTGNERFGCGAIFLHGLSDDDALNLWRAFGITGSRETLLPVFHVFDSHPLHIRHWQAKSHMTAGHPETLTAGARVIPISTLSACH